MSIVAKDRILGSLPVEDQPRVDLDPGNPNHDTAHRLDRRLAARVDAAPPVGWLARPVWPADAYGISSAEKKAGKTWMGCDLAVSVASGTPWLGVYPCETRGPVLLFLGEGGERKMLRRLRAIAATEASTSNSSTFACVSGPPGSASAIHLDAVAEELENYPAVLVIIDPLYLAAAGAKGSDLYGMGAVLESIQLLCQQHGAALMVVTHWNKTGTGNGSDRITGVGPGEWGRVLVSTSVEHRQTQDDRSTVATLKVLFEGDEIPETELRLRRWISADDQDDLASPMHYRVEALEKAPGNAPGEDAGIGLQPSQQRIMTVLKSPVDRSTCTKSVTL